jgi:hypothetical protein
MRMLYEVLKKRPLLDEKTADFFEVTAIPPQPLQVRLLEIHVNHCRWIEIPEIIDGADGNLCVAEEHKAIPFVTRRVYYIYNLLADKQIQRGQHAHKTLEQVMFCINGSCHVTLHDGHATQDVLLCQPNRGLYIGPRLWHSMQRFEDNCILLILASKLFNEDDYIRNYDDYLDYISAAAAG